MTQLADKLLGFPPWLALVLIFALPAAEASIFVGLFFPGELIVLLGGVLANQHKLPLWSVLVVGSAGAIIGDTIGYEVGRHYGDRVLGRLPKRLVKPEHLDRGRDLLRRKGGRAVFLGRFTAALRALIPGLAGTSRLPYRSFLVFNVLGGISWVIVTALTGYAVGSSYRSAEKRLSLISFGILAVVAIAIIYRVLRRSERAGGWARRRLSWLYQLDGRLVIAAAVLVGAAWLFGGVAQDVVEHDGLARSDGRLLHDVIGHRNSVLTPIAKLVTTLGTDAVLYLLLVAFGLAVWRRTGKLTLPVLCLLWLVAGQSLRLSINHAFGRARPPAGLHLVPVGGYAFPSGHTTTATIGYGLVALLALRLLPARPRLVLGAALGLAAGVGLSRIYLGVHWPTDVVGGWSLGAGWLALAGALAATVRLVRERRKAFATREVAVGE